MRYAPRPLPQNIAPGVRAYLDDELQGIARSAFLSDRVQLVERNAEPDRIADGQLIYADGFNFDPGSGESVYARVNSAWVDLVNRSRDDDVEFDDNVAAVFGTGDDFDVYFDGTDLIIERVVGGDVVIRGGSLVRVEDATGNDEGRIEHDGAWLDLRNWDSNEDGGLGLTTGFSVDNANGFYLYASKVIADDATDTWTLRRSAGFVFVTTSSNDDENAIISIFGTGITVVFDPGGKVSIGTSGSNPDVDGDINIWMSSSGVLSIKNRRGGSRNIRLYQMAG